MTDAVEQPAPVFELALENIEAPRTTGEIISDAMVALRRSFKVIFAFAVPFCAVDLLLREVASSFLLQVTSKIDPLNPSPDAFDGAFAPVSIAMGFLIAAYFVQTLLSGGVVAMANEITWRRAPTVRGALAALVERGAALLLTGLLLMVVLTFGMTLAAAVPMAVGFGVALGADLLPLAVVGVVLGMVLMVVTAIVLTLRWSLYMPAVMVERLSFFAALSRSSTLTAPRGLPFFETPKFRLSVLLLVALALSGVLQSLFLGPRLILAGLTGWSFANGSLPGLAQMPVWFMVPFGLLEIVTNAMVIPLSGVLLTLFSFDLRVRYEGVSSSAPPAA